MACHWRIWYWFIERKFRYQLGDSASEDALSSVLHYGRIYVSVSKCQGI